MIKRIPIDRVILKPGFQYKERKLARYQQNDKNGIPMPAIRVRPKYILEDGYHRIESLKRNGHTHVWAFIDDEIEQTQQKSYQTFKDLTKHFGCTNSGAIRIIWDYFN